MPVFAQTSVTGREGNVAVMTKKVTLNSTGGYLASPNGDAYTARIEVSDKILGDWTSVSDDKRSSELTISAWVKLDDVDAVNNWNGDGRTIFAHRQGHMGGYGSEPSFGLVVKGYDDTEKTFALKIVSRVRNAAGGFASTYLSSGSLNINKGEWTHLTMTAYKDGNDVIYTVYKNGVEGLKYSVSDFYDNVNGSDLPYLPDNTNGMGCVLSFGGNMTCTFDDVMIWTKAISQNLVKESMYGFSDSKVVTMKSNGLVGYYLCDEIAAASDGQAAVSVSQNQVSDNFVLTLNALKYESTSGQYVIFTGKFPLGQDGNGTVEPQEGYMDHTRGGYEFEGLTWTTLPEYGEAFGYTNQTSGLEYYAYNGADKVQYPESSDLKGFYYNDKMDKNIYAIPVLSTDEQVGAIEGPFPAPTVVAAAEFSRTMPAAKQWLPIAFPTAVDLVVDTDDANTNNWLAPGANFWYSTLTPAAYTNDADFAKAWNDVKATGDATVGYDYTLSGAGIISVPEGGNRAGHNFSFYSKAGDLVVLKSKNDAVNANTCYSIGAGQVGLVYNPYFFAIQASELCKGMTFYTFNAADNLFWAAEGDVTVAPFESVLVFNSSTGLMAPQCIGAKSVSGIVEFEAVYDVNVYGTRGALVVNAAEEAEVEIYNMNGVKVASDNVEGSKEIALEAGLYIVRTVVDGKAKTVKVVVE